MRECVGGATDGDVVDMCVGGVVPNDWDEVTVPCGCASECTGLGGGGGDPCSGQPDGPLAELCCAEGTKDGKGIVLVCVD